ncbi:hypothetical protein F5B17DRAFT_409665 [Nemania serpens]|nr:hypothetical protein F5B17DRAFT_409665 [Nemania serpens]
MLPPYFTPIAWLVVPGYSDTTLKYLIPILRDEIQSKYLCPLIASSLNGPTRLGTNSDISLATSQHCFSHKRV